MPQGTDISDDQRVLKLECFVPTLNLTLDEIKNAKIALLRVDGKYKVERSIVPVDELRAFSPLGDDAFQVVAERVWPLRHLLEDALYHAFLSFFANLDWGPSGLG